MYAFDPSERAVVAVRQRDSKQWERAAIVYAFTAGEHRGRPSNSRNTPTISAKAFANLGITGLCTQDSVACVRWPAVCAR